MHSQSAVTKAARAVNPLYIALIIMKTTRLLIALGTNIASTAAMACASCGCTLNSDFGSQGLSSGNGWSVDVRYDSLNQNQLRTGTGTISAAGAAQSTNTAVGGPAEVEKYTNNNYLTTTLDYNGSSGWGVSMVVPYIDRQHSTLGVGGDGTNPDPSTGYDSSASGIGDIRVIGRFSGLSDAHNTALQFGLKLPTGSTNQTALADDGATVVNVDPGLQLGTGTTDAILGISHFDNIDQNWDYFVQAQVQSAITTSTLAGLSYRPGDSVNLTGGVRYHGYASFTPTMQVNVRKVETDSGDAADTFSTGGTLVYFTPGMLVPVSATVSMYANVQLPIYQNLNGIQLAPTSIFSIGAHFSF